jgi:beta-glucanase (GH16 family)
MSDVEDEIDWEWVSDHTTEAQSNFFSLGNITYTDGESFKGLSDTSSNFHVYTLNWQEEYLQWIIDGKVQRTLYKNATLAQDGSGR